MVGPFHGMFNDQALGNQRVVEGSTLIAIALYALLAWGLVALAEMLLRPRLASREQTLTTRRRGR